MDQKDFVVMEVKEVKARKGTKAPWIEIVITKPDGTIVKLIARKVTRFWSEQEEGDVL